MKSLRTCNGVALPLSVRALAAGAGLQSAFTLRALMNQTGSRTKVLRVALLRYAWEKPAPSTPPAQWNDSQVREIFFSENGWSVEQYWWRCSMGLFEIVGELFPWRTLPGKQADLDKGRGEVNSRIRAQAATDGVDLTKYDHIITIIDPPPGDRGATGGDVVIDEGPFSFEFFQHEVGHMIGFEHTFGRTGDGTFQAYNDDFDVMGHTNPNNRRLPTPADLASLPLPAGVDFWRSGRRLSAASLYRYVPPFEASASVVRPNTFPTNVRLLGLTRARFGDAAIAVIPTTSGEVTVEYRLRDEDDAGINAAPLLLMHTIGRRALPSGAHEVKPIALEGTSSSTLGSVISTSERDVSATVVDGGNGAPSVTLRIDKIDLD